MSELNGISADDPFTVALDTEGLRQRSARGSAVISASLAFRIVLQFFAQLLLARLLFPADFGMLAMIAPLTSFVQVFADIGLGQAVVQRQSLTQSRVSSLFWISVALSTVLAIVLTALAPLAALVYREPRLTSLIIVLAWMLPISSFGTLPDALMTRQMRFQVLARNEIIATLAGVSVAVTAALLGLRVWALVAGQVASTIMTVAFAWVAARWKPSRPAFSSEAWDDLKFGGNFTVANLATYFTTSGDNIIVGLTTSGGSLGLYDRSYRLVVQPLGQIISPLSRVAVPLLSRLSEAPAAYRSVYLKIFSLLNLLSLPLMIVCITVGDTVISLLLGDRWRSAAPVFSWICVGGMFSAIYTSSFWLFISQGKTNTMKQFMMIAAVINVASYLFGAIWGIVGIAASAALAFAFLTTPLVLFGATRTGPVGFGELVSAEITYLPPSALAAALCLLLKDYARLSAAAQIAACMSVTYAIFGLFCLIVPAQRRMLFSIVSRAWGLTGLKPSSSAAAG